MTAADDASADADDSRLWLELARRGAYADAWTVSDRIRARTQVFADPTRPRHEQIVWNGQAIEGRRVLVRCYHGLGDTIQFARFLPPLARRAASVTVWAQPALLPVLKTLKGRYRWLPLHEGASGVTADVDIEIMELAQWYRPTLRTLPAPPYLHSQPRPVTPARRLRVGIAWQAGDWDVRRSVPLHALTPWFADRRIEWVSLQYPDQRRESRVLLRPLQTPSITALARRIVCLDLVVSVDSMPAHLAGALGTPTWTLLRRHADWRWLEERDDSPWYPTMRLFRQQVDGDWSAPLTQVYRGLDALIAARVEGDQPRAR